MKLYTRGGTSMGTVEFLVCPLSAQVCASCSVHSQQIQAMLTRIACYLYQSLCDELRNFQIDNLPCYHSQSNVQAQATKCNFHQFPYSEFTRKIPEMNINTIDFWSIYIYNLFSCNV